MPGSDKLQAAIDRTAVAMAARKAGAAHLHNQENRSEDRQQDENPDDFCRHGLSDPQIRPEKFGRQPDPVRFRIEQELGTDAGRLELADHLLVLVHAGLLEAEYFLHGDGFAFHAGDLVQAGDLAAAIAEPRYLNSSEEHTSELPSLMRNS